LKSRFHSILLLWMIIHIIKGIFIETKLRDYIKKSSLELISFIEHTAFVFIKIIFNFIKQNEYLDNKLFFQFNSI